MAVSSALRTTRVMAILRGTDADDLEMQASNLVRGGVQCLEISLTTPKVLDLIARLRRSLPPEVEVGAGTVLDVAQARDALSAGAEFVVAPSTAPPVIELCARAGVAIYPGALTPTEIVQGWNAGATAIKLFPAMLGGPAYVRQLRQPLPHIPFIAVGGVDPKTAIDYLAAGAVAVGMGSSLGASDAGDSSTGVVDRIRKLMAACAAPTEGHL